jgi:hypothetical protein
VDAKSWRVREMFEELDPLMSEFEKLLPDGIRPWENPPDPTVRIVAMQETCSTATPPHRFVLVGSNATPAKRSESE